MRHSSNPGHICPACTVDQSPPPAPSHGYIAGVVEQERGKVVGRLCPFHEKMRLAFHAAAEVFDGLDGLGDVVKAALELSASKKTRKENVS
jgi:hypothetical protein